MDSIFYFDKNLYGLHVHILLDLPNVGMGNKKTQDLQEIIRRQVPERKKSNVPIYYLNSMMYVHLNMFNYLIC